MLVAFQLVGVPAVPLKVTVLVLCVAPKLLPVIVTNVPTGPVLGLTLLMLGADEVTVKPTPLLPTPPTLTTTGPVVAPLGTGTTMLVALQLVGVPAVPLKVTVLVLCVAPKLLPVIVTNVPTGPVLGLALLMLGAPTPLPAALNAAKPAAQRSAAPSEAPAEPAPAVACIWSSAISFVLGSTGTLSSIL
jgi:hypothetical protein